MKTRLLNNGVAIEVLDADISNITPDEVDAIRELLLNNVIVVLKKQDTSSAYFTKFVSMLGPICDYAHLVCDPITGEAKYIQQSAELEGKDPLDWPDPKTYPVQRVTGKLLSGQRTGIFGTGVLDWHSDLNNPTGPDGTALQGISDCEGTSTTWLNTALAYDKMPSELKERCNNVLCEYEYSPEIWAAGMPEPQAQGMIRNKCNYKMWLIQENVAGRTGMYFYPNNRCKLITDDTNLYNDLINFVFQEKFMYRHAYQTGDVVISDQLLSLHKRDQNDPAILEKRVLHRLTYNVSNVWEDPWIAKYNEMKQDFS